MTQRRTKHSIPEAPKDSAQAKGHSFWRQMPLSEALTRNWLILGSIGKIGAKAEDILRKEKAISEAGFSTYPRLVLAMDFVESFLKRSDVNEKMEDDEAKAAIMKTNFTKDEIRQVMDAIRWFGGVSLAIRSSAHGDASGTGIYESVIIGKKDERKGCSTASILDAIKTVLASHFTEGARIFREKLGLPSGIAIIIEPAFVQPMKKVWDFDNDQVYESKYESCEFGGIGHTSEINMFGKKEEAIYISAGLPTTVVSGGGIRISPNDFSSKGSSIWDFEEKFEPSFFDAGRSVRYNKIREAISEGYVIGDETTLYHNSDIEHETFHESLEKLIFSKLRKLEHDLGVPQYIEFGVRQINGKIGVACFQIADEKAASKDKVELFQNGDRFIWSNIVVGKGVFDSDTLVTLFGSGGVYDLYHFNQMNKDYILVYNGMVLCSFEKSHNNISISYVSNASVLAEYIPYISHDNLANHWGGLSNVLGKLLIGMSGNEGAWWMDKLQCVEEKSDFRVFKGNFRAVSDGRQAVVYDMGKKDAGVSD